MSCKQCEKIKLRDSIPDVMEYGDVIRQFKEMTDAGELEVTYQTCPFDWVFGDGSRFFAPRMFHQVRCTSCGTIYGLICDTRIGEAQLKTNPRVFNPNDYEIVKVDDKKDKK